MKILVLTRYEPLGASSRLRFFAYKDRFIAEGWSPTYQSLFPESYLKQIYSGRSASIFFLLKVYFKRFFFLMTQSHNFDVVWVEKELFPGWPTFIDRFFLKKFKKVILDYDDAVHLNYQKSGWGRQNKIEKLMSLGDFIFAGSPYLFEVAQKSLAKKVSHIPTPVDPGFEKNKKNEKLQIGWIGSPSAEAYLLDILPVIKEMTNFDFFFLGTQSAEWRDLKHVHCLPWNEENQKEILEKIDIGLMPLRNGDWEKGKCAYKILLYNANGIPAIASAVGMNNDVVEDGVNGLLVNEDWFEKLNSIKEMPDEDFLDMARSARQKIEQSYSYEKIYPKIHQTFSDLNQRAD